MAKRLNDEDRRPGDEDEGQWVARRHPEVDGRVRGRAAGPGPVGPAQADHLDGGPGQGRGRPNYLVVNRSMDPELAYQLTQLLFDQKKALAEVHPSAGRLELETAPKVAPLELHPGARRYYDEQAST